MIRDAGALESALLGSHTPKTTNTRTKPKKNSSPTPWTGVMPFWRLVLPRLLSSACGIITYN